MNIDTDNTWSQTPRSLTTAANNLASIGGKTTVAISTILDLRPAAGKFRQYSMLINDGTANHSIGGYDGTTYAPTFTGTRTDMVHSGGGNSAYAMAFASGGTGALTAVYAGFEIS
jgi:hypothetical protein